ncbi:MULTISPECIES: 5-oxoprolinase subunit PxpA [Priestia]|uniref:LamB/YcsF family protein n=1 Tax=Priestia TaxID=2800373 RepID=UPI0028780496|nr:MULTISPECIES: 5-oxoprolinase subunit PxpA [Priestia]MBX4160945.1 5-oxoprolinase subunit PxpA [Priestia megaterium]MED3894994.1 LamB/YcsF family protein [Priestia aryabhattai]
MTTVDLNCDLGESFGNYKLGNDKEILRYVTSANIACGFHAGDPSVMRETVKLALSENVAIGAHPGLQDLAGFGRRYMKITPREAYDLMVYQMGALSAFIRAEGGILHHVKPHGALYNMAAGDRDIAKAVAEAVYNVSEEAILYGLAGSESIKAGNEMGLRTSQEVFADRTYQHNGMLTPRNVENAVIQDEGAAISQVIKMVKEKKVLTVQNEEIPIQADTVCIHGDGAHAVEFAKAICDKLKEEQIIIQPQ